MIFFLSFNVPIHQVRKSFKNVTMVTFLHFFIIMNTFQKMFGVVFRCNFLRQVRWYYIYHISIKGKRQDVEVENYLSQHYEGTFKRKSKEKRLQPYAYQLLTLAFSIVFKLEHMLEKPKALVRKPMIKKMQKHGFQKKKTLTNFWGQGGGMLRYEDFFFPSQSKGKCHKSKVLFQAKQGGKTLQMDLQVKNSPIIIIVAITN